MKLKNFCFEYVKTLFFIVFTVFAINGFVYVTHYTWNWDKMDAIILLLSVMIYKDFEFHSVGKEKNNGAEQ